MVVTVVGGGLAGSEAAWQLASRGIQVRLIEMKPMRFSPAHQSQMLAELVCSNSLRSTVLHSGPGLLKEELLRLNSLIMEAAKATSVPAGKALAVDRGLFERYVTDKIEQHPNITIQRQEVTSIPSSQNGIAIIASGPLTSDALAGELSRLFGTEGLSFYDAIAPIVVAESLDLDSLFLSSRYDVGESDGDYLNAPMDKDLYHAFVSEILKAEKVNPHPFENIPHFEGCLPIEILATRGPETLAFGPMKPVGLVDPKTGERPYAVVQLRAENRERTLYNLVGFQTKMTYAAQERVFRMIPGLKNATFARLGSVHRNTYINSPELLDEFTRARNAAHLFFAGQMTGVEGYIESTASGLITGIYVAHLAKGYFAPLPPDATAVGALMKHIREKPLRKFEPMNINFGLIAPADKRIPKKQKKEFIAERALRALQQWREALQV